MMRRGEGDHVSPRWKPDEQDADDPKGPPRLTSAALATTDGDGLVGRSRGSLWELRLNALQSDLYRSLRLDSFHAAINLLAYLDLPGAGDAHNIGPCLL